MTAGPERQVQSRASQELCWRELRGAFLGRGHVPRAWSACWRQIPSLSQLSSYQSPVPMRSTLVLPSYIDDSRYFIQYIRKFPNHSLNQKPHSFSFTRRKHFVVVQSLSHVQLFAIPWAAARQTSLSFTLSRSLIKLMSFKSVIPSNHLILCHSVLLPPSIFPASGSFPVSQLFTSGAQSIGASAWALILPMNIQGWFTRELY